MQIIDRYIIKNVAIATAITAAIVTIVVWLTQALRLIELVLDRGAPVSMLMYMLILTIPTFLGLIIPLGYAAAVIFVYYRLMMESELVVIRAVGMSNWRLARPVIVLSLFLVVLGYGISANIAPFAQRELAREQFLIKNDYALVLLRDGMFNRLKDGVTVYVRERVGMNELRGVLMHDQSKSDVTTTLFAEKGVLEQEAGGTQLMLLNGLRQEKNVKTKQISELTFKQYGIDMSQYSGDYNNRELEPREQEFWQLIKNRYMAANPTITGRMISEMHQRLVLPWASLSFALLALVILLTAQINRRGMIKRLVAGAIGITVWQVLLLTSVNMIPKNDTFVPLLYGFMFAPLPVLVVLLMGRLPNFMLKKDKA